MNVKNLTNRKHYVSAHGSNDNLILPGSPCAVQSRCARTSEHRRSTGVRMTCARHFKLNWPAALYP